MSGQDGKQQYSLKKSPYERVRISPFVSGVIGGVESGQTERMFARAKKSEWDPHDRADRNRCCTYMLACLYQGHIPFDPV